MKLTGLRLKAKVTEAFWAKWTLPNLMRTRVPRQTAKIWGLFFWGEAAQHFVPFIGRDEVCRNRG